HRYHHCAEVIGLEHGVASLDFFKALAAAQHFKAMSEVVQVSAVSGVDDANAFKGDIERLSNFFDLGAVAQKDGCAEAKRVKLASRLKYAGFGAFRENDSL